MNSQTTDTLVVDIWSDIACPWCYVGKRRFEQALAGFEPRAVVRVRWRAFELDPDSPAIKDPAQSYAQRLASKYATSLARAQEMIDTMTATAAGEGLDFHFERIRPGNTFDAHRLLHLAAEDGRAEAVKERFLRGYLSEGEAIGEREALARMASEAGLDATKVRATLAADTFAHEVRMDEEEARARRIQGVPYFLIAGRDGLSGAQPPQMLLRALQQAWQEQSASQLEAGLASEGACGLEGCD